jgi:hypothetical protein
MNAIGSQGGTARPFSLLDCFYPQPLLPDPVEVRASSDKIDIGFARRNQSAKLAAKITANSSNPDHPNIHFILQFNNPS